VTEDEEIKAKCPRSDSIWSLGWCEGYKACNKNTAQAYLKGFDEGCKSMSARNGDTTGRWRGKTENIGSLGMPVNVSVTPPKREWVGLTDAEIIGHTCECVNDGTFNMDCAIDFANSMQETLKRYNK